MKTIQYVLFLCGITVISGMLPSEPYCRGGGNVIYHECSVTCGQGITRWEYICDGNSQIRTVRCHEGACPSREPQVSVINGGWSSWKLDRLGVCSGRCGVGYRTRYEIRTCTNPAPRNGGTNCGTGNRRSLTESCDTGVKCSVNGAWTAWKLDQLGDCSVTCGVGSRRRYQIRTCTNPAPQNGGKNCGTENRRSSIETCDTRVKCPVKGGWSSWGYDQLGDCSVTCGVGSRRRYQIRTCTNPAPQNGGKGCGTENKRNLPEPCDTQVKCPVNGAWTAWKLDQLGDCSVTCGVGSRRRYQIRTCTNPAPQNGGKNCGTENRRSSIETCDTRVKCPVKGGWSSWGYDQLGDCSVTCGVGSRRRYQIRTCTNPAPQNGGKGCGTENKRNLPEPCDTQVKCPVNGAWTAWKLDRLGDCSVTCGVGSRRRYQIRTCTNPAPQNGGKDCATENTRNLPEPCDTKVKCPVNGGWSRWKLDRLGDCSVTCDVGSRTRYEIRTCTNPAPQNGGRDCGTQNKRSSSESCDTKVKCPVNGAWTAWKLDRLGDCSVTCGVGSRRRYQIRTCTNPAPQNGGKDCGTENTRNLPEPCDTKVKCPVDGGWSRWKLDRLGDCSVTCDVGSRTRYEIRTCTNAAPQNGGKDCGTENKRSSSESCDTKVKCPGSSVWPRSHCSRVGVWSLPHIPCCGCCHLLQIEKKNWKEEIKCNIRQ
ncbi:coadhesin-like [Gigantopelta aegis]|uniref:coadhesin-like n=1 Tax=Gigantopelta aegis TaxID=1735272 RepID=UPI001B889CC1|nr:coadhesin-like [Gigantopelta aegis]